MQPGRELLHYRIVDKIGEGGMGVVWKATDTTLGRDVAIKMLPDALSQESEGLARFEREARMLASLNHPNIASVYGLHEADGLRFIAMELVEGEDLAQRLERGRLSTDNALKVGAQVARALEAAHASGVIHRDLKPANIVMTPDGTVKVLDFGLAKAADPDAASASGSLSLSPTMTSAGTAAGMILGTAAYMSPEQARGKPVDRRTDLWSLGCVIHECLTGERLFRGETVSDSLAAILRKEPDWSALPADTPPMVRLLLRRCLTRDPARRIQDAGDARLELEQAIEDPGGESLGLAAATDSGAAATRAVPGWLPWLVAAAALVVAGYFGLRGDGPVQEASSPLRLTIPLPGLTEFGDNQASPPAISPDGRQVVFGITGEDGETQLWVRPLDAFAARPLDETQGAQYAFWSPDSRHVGFFRAGKLRRIEVATGRVQPLVDEGSSFPRGGSWSAGGRILFAPNSNTGIHLVNASGGDARQLTRPDPDVPDSSHRWPHFLPDGEHYLFISWTNDLKAQEEHGGVFVASISSDAEPERVIPDASSVVYVPQGYLLLVRGDNLIAVPFDAERLRITGEPSVIATGVLRNRATGHSAFSASMDGTLVYAGGQAFTPSTLTWFDRSGKASPVPVEPAPYFDVRLAPDGARAAATMPGPSGDGEIWILDLVRGARTRLAYGLWPYEDPAWSGDGRRIMFTSSATGAHDIYVRPADGSGEEQPVLLNETDKVLYDWSRDGRYAAYFPIGVGTGSSDLWIYSMESRESVTLLAGESNYSDARFSPDSRFIAYVSDDSGRMEVYVQALVDEGEIRGGAKLQVSTGGGDRPHWRDDGREIVYVDPERRVMSVAVETRGESLDLGRPQPLFTVHDAIVGGDATGDHQRFIFATRDVTSSEPLHVIVNWLADL